jgi:hypothetical protein
MIQGLGSEQDGKSDSSGQEGKRSDNAKLLMPPLQRHASAQRRIWCWNSPWLTQQSSALQAIEAPYRKINGLAAFPIVSIHTVLVCKYSLTAS